MLHPHSNDRAALADLARKAMVDYGLEPDYPPPALSQLAAIAAPAQPIGVLRDMRDLLWASIDNDDSRDLDQLTVAEPLANGRTRILVAVANVDALVPQSTPLDAHATLNTTSVYTPGAIFPMLPEKLSTGLTSLNEDEDRIAVVADMVFDPDGAMSASEIYRAQVRNRAKLAYHSMAAWLDGKGPAPQRVSETAGLAENLRLQDRIAQQLFTLRHRRGALCLETIETRALFDGDALRGLDRDRSDRGTQLIEDFMIAANGATAGFLKSKQFPSFRRVLRSPERWERIARLAAGFGARLPATPDSLALETFLSARRAADPERFPDLSLTVIKLIGRGEYDLYLPGGEAPGHFGLAVRDYTHSTAPNRRFPDLLTQRLLKAALDSGSPPYSVGELGRLATHCTDQEDAAAKVERRMRKSAAALLLSRRIGQRFDAIVTGASEKGTWVRIFHPPAEGRLERGCEGRDVGDHLSVTLVHTDFVRGYIDFACD